MKTPFENPDETPPDWMRWLDGEMTAAEREVFERQLAGDPALRAEVETARQLSGMLKRELPAEMDMPHADFFNSQIQVRLAQMEAEERRNTSAAKKTAWLDWLRSPWLAGAAAAVIAVLLLRPGGEQIPASETVVMRSYAPDPDVVVSSYHSSAAAATVLVLEGLEELPADRKIVGWQLNSGEADPASMSTVFRNAAGQVELVLTRDANQQPRLWTPRS